MRASLPLLACAALVLGVTMTIFGTETGGEAGLLAAPPGPAAPASQARVDALVARIQALTDRVDELSMEITTLRTSSGRAPIEAALGEEVRPGATSAATLPREAIVEVITEERERLAAERRLQREQRELDLLLARAEGIARELGLAPGEEKILADVLIEERRRITELLSGLKEERTPEARVAVKLALKDLASWRSQELTQRLGPVTGELVVPILDGRRKGGDKAGKQGKRGDDRSSAGRSTGGGEKNTRKRRRDDG
ncbi:MAG: hypothetical protein E2O39_00085 [Planctomycetota bacterium]|nr:MAG: hypothetical protein E2O39_00085 [Planctomycetota bacterium]